ncbi:FAD-dependent oxidoreductase [Halomarina rubra]|uniref:FAD-dependent oxidoreductase n=1 Tax=Halomarina rubra TaxID=2071873 RepID=A0ABD6AY39_9EURY|nr:FAD-dependent oxidoreductase [Halomarina rubra]
MPHVVVVGGGPGGLSAALFAAKNGLETSLFDTGTTALRFAGLANYLGLGPTDGEAFLRVAREQVAAVGVDHHAERVLEVEADGEEFVVVTARGMYAADYLVLATGRSRELAAQLSCAFDDDGTVAVDRDGRTSVVDVYAVGWLTRKEKVQAVISAGDGAAAALDILSTVAGSPVHDFDTPADSPHDRPRWSFGDGRFDGSLGRPPDDSSPRNA